MAGHDNLAYAPVHAPVTVVARFLAKDGQEARVEETLRAMVAPTRAEEACISYDLYRSRDQSAVFYMLENWRRHCQVNGSVAAPERQEVT